MRRTALLAHFGLIDRPRAACLKKIQEVAGFGPTLATELFGFPHRTPPEAPPAG